MERKGRSLRLLSDQPETPVVMFSFLLHFVWEYLQVPTYAGMAEMQHWEGVKFCTSATLGDVGFALTAYWTACLVARSRHWLLCPRPRETVAFLALGVALTVAAEYYYTNISLRWAYADLMPLVPPFGTGLSPLLQWLAVPPLVLWLSRRHLLGAARLAKRDEP